jgi:hypothetical protein
MVGLDWAACSPRDFGAVSGVEEWELRRWEGGPEQENEGEEVNQADREGRLEKTVVRMKS